MMPKILLSFRSDPAHYISAVEAADGQCEAHYLLRDDAGFDGLLLGGGDDILPALYGQFFCGTRKTDPARDLSDLALIRSFLDAGKPILGICRGCQILNVYFGGTLIQHLPTATLHEKGVAHETVAAKGSLLSSLYGTHFFTDSRHHQAIERLGRGLRAVQWAVRDHTVEAVQHESLPVFAVQWHPEKMCLERSRRDTVDGLAVFAAFVDFCR